MNFEELKKAGGLKYDKDYIEDKSIKRTLVEKSQQIFFGNDEIYKDGVVVRGENGFVMYTSHEGYKDLMNEVFKELKKDIDKQLNNGDNNTEHQGDSKG